MLENRRSRQLLGVKHVDNARSSAARCVRRRPMGARIGGPGGGDRALQKKRCRSDLTIHGSPPFLRICTLDLYAWPGSSVWTFFQFGLGTLSPPIAHSRQTRLVQVTGQPPPSAMNNAAVSASRLASVCTRMMEAVR